MSESRFLNLLQYTVLYISYIFLYSIINKDVELEKEVENKEEEQVGKEKNKKEKIKEETEKQKKTDTKKTSIWSKCGGSRKNKNKP